MTAAEFLPPRSHTRPEPADELGIEAVQRRVIAVLVVSEVLAGVGAATSLAVSSLTTVRVSGSQSLGGLSLTAVVVGAAAMALVLAWVATRFGRRPSLTLGFGVGAVGAGGAVAAVAVDSTSMLLLGLLLTGAASAAGLAARFTATDLAAPHRRARALAAVVWAATVGAVAGPNLAGPAAGLGPLTGLPGSAGPFLLCLLAFAGATAVTWFGLRPDPLLLARAREHATDPEPREAVHLRDVCAAVLASPGARLGIAGVALGHLVMTALMSMTPVHMDHGGAQVELVGLVISVHLAGMYVLSPLFGRLADRIGRIHVLVVACALLLASAAASAVAAPHATTLLGVGLLLLGLGWSASLIAGSALLTESLPTALRPRAQGLADVAMNLAGALGGIAAGTTMAMASFATLALLAAAIMVPCLLVAGRTMIRPKNDGPAVRP